jgi:hypothetical protein
MFANATFTMFTTDIYQKLPRMSKKTTSLLLCIQTSKPRSYIHVTHGSLKSFLIFKKTGSAFVFQLELLMSGELLAKTETFHPANYRTSGSSSTNKKSFRHFTLPN